MNLEPLVEAAKHGAIALICSAIIVGIALIVSAHIVAEKME